MTKTITLAALFGILTFLGGYATGQWAMRKTEPAPMPPDNAELARFQKQVAQLQSEKDSMEHAYNTVNEDRDSCRARFQKETYLYEAGALTAAKLHWVIPAEIQPKLVNSFGEAFYTTVDPKTHIETQHLKPR